MRKEKLFKKCSLSSSNKKLFINFFELKKFNKNKENFKKFKNLK